MSTRPVVEGGVLAVAGVLALLFARRLAEHAEDRSWPTPFTRRPDGAILRCTALWGYRTAGAGWVAFGVAWLVMGLR